MFDAPKVMRGLLPLRMLLATAALLCGTLPAHAANYHVGAGCTYTTIQAAVTDATHTGGSRPNIYIATNQTYSDQAISISPDLQSHMTLIGGVPDCSTTVSSGNTTIDGGNAGTSVFTIRGAISVTLSHLTISGGNDVIGGNDDEGGGIDYAGIGSLSLDNTTVFDNHADNGGGIRFKGDGGAADLYLNANTFITNNMANDSGGGIRVEDNATAHIDADPIWIAQNEATNGKGGGIAMVGKTTAHIGSPGYLSGGVIYANTAQYGGGIALIASASDAVPTAQIFAADPTHPVRIEQNRAYLTGGGIYLEPWNGNSGVGIAVVDLGGAQIDGNAAQEGSGIYADTDSFTGMPVGCIVGFDAGHCAAGIECNTVSNNRAVDGSDNPTAGSAILIQTEGFFEAHQLAMRGNQGAHEIRVADSLLSPLHLDTCLLAGNTVVDALITLGNASAVINQCTIANNNTSPGHPIVLANADLTLTDSVFAQGSQQTLINLDGGANMTLDYLMSGETDSLIGGNHVIQSDPAFVDPGNGDFHLRLDSLAVDYAPAGASGDKDLDNRPRDQDLPERLNAYGPRDLGAYERQLSDCDVGDTVFCNGFDTL